MQSYLNEYLNYIIKIKGVSKEYSRNVQARLERLIAFLTSKGIIAVDRVTREILTEYQEKILKRDISINTKRDELLAVGLFFRFLHEYEYIDENPGIIIEVPKKTRNLPKSILGEQEIAYLLSLPDKNDFVGIRDYCIMSLLYSSMMRTKELFNLTLGDIDLRYKQIIVRRTKNKRDRIVHIDNYTVFFIKKYIKNARPWLLKRKESAHLFISATGTNLNRGAFATHFRNRYEPIIKKKFNKHVTPYCFRHSSATHWLDGGARHRKDILPYIQRQLGHKSLESTVIYTRVAIEPLREMFRKYHPRELSMKKLHKIPAPDEIIASLNRERRQKD